MKEPKGTGGRRPWVPVLRQLLPGMVLPGAIYAAASRFVPSLTALVLASSVPVIDVAKDLLRRRSPSPASVGFLGMAGLTSAMSLWARSPAFILAKGPAVSALAGTAFLLSGGTRKPLCRTLALKLTAGLPEESRQGMVAEWNTERSLHVFRVLSVGWGLLLLACGAQQTIMAMSLPPGMALALESPVHLTAIGAGIAASVLYVKRAHPILTSLARA